VIRRQYAVGKRGIDYSVFESKPTCVSHCLLFLTSWSPSSPSAPYSSFHSLTSRFHDGATELASHGPLHRCMVLRSVAALNYHYARLGTTIRDGRDRIGQPSCVSQGYQIRWGLCCRVSITWCMGRCWGWKSCIFIRGRRLSIVYGNR
jgi:hypothetical protein